MGFCSHRWKGEPWFDPFLGSLSDKGERRDLLQWKRSQGQSGVVLAPRYAYPPITNHPRHLQGRPEGMSDREFVALIEEVIDAGMFAWLYLIGDLPPAAIYDGRLAHMAQLVAPYAASIYGGYEWEPSRTGSWGTSKQNSDAILVLREHLGDRALLFLHTRPAENDAADGRATAASFPWESDDPSGLSEDGKGGDEIGWWYSPAGLETDIFAFQTRHGSWGPSSTLDVLINNEPTWLYTLIEDAERFLPDGTMNYFGHPVRTRAIPKADKIAPDWFARPRRRGRPTLCMMEDVPVEFSRGQVSDEWVRRKDAVIVRTGVTSWGCMGAR